MGLKRASRRSFQLAVLLPALAALIALLAQSSAMADKAAPPPPPTVPLIPGNLLVSTSVYQNDPNIVAGSTQLPPRLHQQVCDRECRRLLPLRVQQRRRRRELRCHL